MVELVHTLVGRAYKFLGRRLHARRHKIRLPMKVALLDLKAAAVSLPCSPSMSGYLRDISETGLSLVVPSIRFGNRFLLSGHDPLQVTIELPNREVNIQVAPVRYDKLFDERRYLIGARIMQMTESDREHLTQYIQQVEKSKATSFSFERGAHSA